MAFSGAQRVSLRDLAQRVVARAAERGPDSTRYVLGIAGPPAAGKSTFSTTLRDEINQRFGARISEVAPMDGFHLTNARLESTGDLKRKGEPDTFDAASYARHVARLRAEGTVDLQWPTYDRNLHDPVPAGVTVGPETRIVITEGNYLLLDSGDWAALREHLDDAWFLDADLALVERRLVARHRAGGKSDEEARRKTTVSDLPNARLVAASKDRADLVLRESNGLYVVVKMCRAPPTSS